MHVVALGVALVGTRVAEREMIGATLVLGFPASRTPHRPSSFLTVASSIADAIDLVAPTNRPPDLHGHLGATRGVCHRLVLDLE